MRVLWLRRITRRYRLGVGAAHVLPVSSAFNTGMLTLTADLKIHTARRLADAARGDHLTRPYYGRPPLLDTLLLPDDAERPRRKYLDWHREKVFDA